LVEQPNGDWGQTVTRQFFFSVYQYFLYDSLQQSRDEMLAAIAAKSVREVAYHLRWSSEWMIRLGDGTDESHHRMQQAVDTLWQYTGELYDPAAFETTLAAEGIAIDPATFAGKAQQKINEILALATLRVPQTQWMHNGGKSGIHSEHLGYLLAEMQFLQRAYPGAEW
jgi:ring-1,2-phenylacetyl-CoA epoxidase subunit PaaC